MLIAPNSKLLMIGDSITYASRKPPFGDSEKPGTLGDGYVSLAHSLLSVTYPTNPVRVINTGVSGDRVIELKARWQRDVLAHQPDWLAVMIGVNDVWKKFCVSPLTRAGHVPLDVYTATLEGLISSTRSRLKGVILLSPFLIQPKRDDPMRAMLDQYGAAVREIAVRQQAVYLDTQRVFDGLLRSLPRAIFGDDRIHPNQTGHMAIARALVNALAI